MKLMAWATLAAVLVAAPAHADKKLDDTIAKAEEQVQKGRAEEGLKNLQKLVSQMNTAEAWIALARFQRRIGNMDDALESAKKASQVATAPADKATALVGLASFDLLIGTGRDALAHAQEAVNLQASVESLSALARAQARLEDSVSALASADKAIAANAQSALGHEAKGEALLAARRAGEAVAAFQKALELDPKHELARVGLATALLDAGKPAEAAAEARKLIAANDQSAEAYAALGLALLKENPNNWSGAIAEAQQGAFLNARSVLVQLAVGRIFEAAGNYDQSALAFKRASEIDPGFAPAALAVIETQERRGDLNGALAAAQKLVADAPKSGEAQFLLGRLLLRKNDFAGAAKALKAATTQAPGIADAHAYLGTALQYIGQTSEAVLAYKQAVERAPQNTMYRATYGLLLGLDSQFEQGAAELQKVIASPGYKDTAGYTNLGWIYRSMTPKKTAEAVTAYKKALELDPTNEQAALGMGWSYSYQTSYDEAIRAFHLAIQIEPKTAAEAYNGIAWCQFFKKDLEQAKAFLDKAQTAGRSDPRLRDNIERFEKLKAQQAAYEEALRRAEQERAKGDDLGALQRAIRNGSPGAKVNAIGDLTRAAGTGAVPSLIGALNDESASVREAAVRALGSLGKGAAQAKPYLMEILNGECGKTIMDKKEMEESLRCEDVKRLARDVVLKLN
ncbi:MAG: tetratricopeptide repeat protein [Vicinamibacteria bacterium]